MFTINLEGDTLHISLPAVAASAVVLEVNKQTFHHQLDDASPAPPITLSQLEGWVGEFVVYLQINENLKPKTIKGYVNRLGQFMAWLGQTGQPPAARNTWRAYYASLAQRGLSPYTVKGHYHILDRFGRWLAENNYVPQHPLGDVLAPKTPKNRLPKAAFEATIAKMIEMTTRPRDRAILLFFRDTGIRAEESLQLTWGDLDMGNNQARIVGKGDKERYIFWSPLTAQALSVYRQTHPNPSADSAVFWGKRGPLTYNGLYKIFKRMAEAAGVDYEIFGPHSFRHAFGRDTTIHGLPTAQLQKLLGHSSLSVTEIYAQFDTTELREAHDKYGPLS